MVSSTLCIMENVLLCSVCGREEASFFCVCTPAFHPLCSSCKAKHIDSPGFHYSLPLARMGTVSAQHYREWKNWLLNLSDSQKELLSSLGELERLRGDTNWAFAYSIRTLEDQRDKLLKSLDDLCAIAIEAVNAAVRETDENSTNGDYQPTTDLATMIWDKAKCQCSAPFSILTHSLDVSEDALLSCVKVSIDFCVKELEECTINQEIKKKKTLQQCAEPCLPILVLETLPEIQVFPRILKSVEKSVPGRIVDMSSALDSIRAGSKSKPSSRAAAVKESYSPSSGGIWSCRKCDGVNLESDTSCMHCQSIRAGPSKT